MSFNWFVEIRGWFVVVCGSLRWFAVFQCSLLGLLAPAPPQLEHLSSANCRVVIFHKLSHWLTFPGVSLVSTGCKGSVVLPRVSSLALYPYAYQTFENCSKESGKQLR